MAPKLGGEFPFEIEISGYAGELRLKTLPPVYRETAVDNLPEFILPPAFPPETPELCRQRIEEKYLTPRLDSEVDDVTIAGKFWDLDWFGNGVKQFTPSLQLRTLSPVWEPPYRRKKTADNIWVPSFEEVEVEHANEHASSTLPEDFMTGNQPLKAAGIGIASEKASNLVKEKASNLEKAIPEGALNGKWLAEVLEGGPLQTVAPGLKRGLELGCPTPFARRSADSSVSNSTCTKQENIVTYEEVFRKAWEEEMLEDEDEEEDEMDDANLQQQLTSDKTGSEADDIAEEVSEIKEREAALDNILSTVDRFPLPAKQDMSDKDWVVMDDGRNIVDRFAVLIPDMAIKFPFELDTFQKVAIYHLERNESVFVAAHTSAGKTVVAEYAFALAALHCTRAVYTSPIKTISNQKYRDFGKKFDVGLVTGDVSMRPEASCLIMTTEILRSMLYKGADIIRDIEWVIFDEVHYVNDAERGVVWEEVIIMLPDHVKLVFLSATVPNIKEFADWVGRTKKKKIYVTGTSRRPVPLEHCLYYGGELHKICENEVFLVQGVKSANYAQTPKGPSKSGSTAASQNRSHGRGQTSSASATAKAQAQRMIKAATESNQKTNAWRSEASQWYSLVNNLSKKSLLPVIVFCFSRNRCDQSADSMTASDLTSTSEKSVIRVFCDKAFSRLKGTDRQLPQVVRIQELLRRGIGVHHAGLLPIVKEVVEMLFCKGVIKVLFSTETFAMGVNAPARTVAFHGLKKHDGKTFRQLESGEYTQMAGRAGRRGLDKVGTVVIMCWDEVPGEGDLRRLLTGKPTKLESQFRLTYTMILNLHRVEGLKVEDMLRRSFAEFRSQRALPEQEQQLLKEQDRLLKMNTTIDCLLVDPTLQEYYNLSKEADDLGEDIQEAVMQSRAAQQALVPGRIVTSKLSQVSMPSIGVVLRGPTGTTKDIVVLSLYSGPISTANNSSAILKDKVVEEEDGFYIRKKSSRGNEDFFSGSRKSGIVRISFPHYGTVTTGDHYIVTQLTVMQLVNICKEKIRVNSQLLLEDVSLPAYSTTVEQLLELRRQYPEEDPPALDPVKDLKLNDIKVVESYRKRQVILQQLGRNKWHRCPKSEEQYGLIKNQQALKGKVNLMKHKISDEALEQMENFRKRIEVLKHIGCMDEDLIVQIKGRVTCEINSGDELITTECLLENQLGDLDPAECVSLLSALVFQQRDASEALLTPTLATAKQRLLNTATELGQIQAHHGLTIHAEDYVRDTLNFGLMEVVHEWAKGTPFAEICELTNVAEGTIVRTIVRLDELVREIKNAARIMGDLNLCNKMEEASNLIKRDIVFAASLYVT